MKKNESGLSEEEVLALVGSAAFLALVFYAAVAWPTFFWAALHGDWIFVNPFDAVGGAIRWLIEGAHGDPRSMRAFAGYRDVMPPPTAWIALDAAGLVGTLAGVAFALARVDRWRGSRPVALPSWSLRNRVTSRPWAKPRDLVHLQPRQRGWRGVSTGLARLVAFDRRAPAPADGDSWPLGKLRGRTLRSEGERHLMAVAPTRSGKTTRVLVPALLEHDGPAIVLLNKTEVVRETLKARARRGPVWIYAPLTAAPADNGAVCGWTPLLGCEEWEQALRMGRWFLDADPAASTASNDSGGARFYNREAIVAALPPLLHAAALDGRSMASIHGWLRSGIEGLDEPRAILSERSATAAADSIAGVQALDERPRSLLLMSAAQLVDAYRFPSVQQADRPDFRPEDLLGGGTLYMVAPDSDQELLAPVFGGLLGAVLRVWEQQSAGGRRADRPLLRILADEAAHLAPLGNLPTYLSVSAGWGVRWCLIYQSLAQLEHRYGREADSVLCKLFLGPIQDATTRDYLGELLDEETVTASSWSAGPLGASGPRTNHERQAAKVSAQRADAAWRGPGGDGARPRPPGGHPPPRVLGAGAPRAMMTAASIAAASAQGYADYLESRTAAPERGDYYLGSDGTPAESPGRWLTPADALGRVGIERGDLRPGDLRALMEGRAPGSPAEDPAWLRPTGADGTRAGGLDVTFSAPKPVSVAWAIGGPRERAAIERAHSRAVARAVGYLRDRVPLTSGPGGPAPARELHAAEFRHTTARGAAGAVPDPQLHSHVVIASVERADGTVAAVRSRPAFAAAREVGAYYRAELAHGLGELGYDTVSAGKDQRYFGIRGVGEQVSRAFSKRTEEVHRAAQRFQAEHGRDPERGELRSLALKSREAKLPRTREELDGAWHATAADNALTDVPLAEPADPRPEAWAQRVVRHATRRSAVFDERELRCVALEQAAGTGLAPSRALADIADLREHGRIVELADGAFTTARMRALESRLEQEFGALAGRPARTIPADSVERAICATEERIGSSLTAEQRIAVATLTGPERAAVLVGQAGTGKGVVLDAAARAELAAGRSVVGVAVAGRTAQRLGEESPALAGRVRTLDGLVTAMDHDRGNVGGGTTVYVDEAGMGDTERLGRLVTAIEERGAALVLIGDSHQLSSVGAGGMFDRLHALARSAELTHIHRTDDAQERAAWSALRSGDPALAMAHYRERGALHFSDSRTQAVDRAARRYLELAAEHGHGEVALMTDASNAEVDALNLRVQQLRLETGELGSGAIEHPGGGWAIRSGDRVAWSRSMTIPGAARVENGVRGEAIAVDDQNGSVRVRLDGSAREVEVTAEDADGVRLGYAGHVYRQQGATVERAVAVTGGWQTSREGAYVEASRARHGVEWHVARDELDGDGDAERIDHLAARMRVDGAQTPSLARDLAGPSGLGPRDVKPALDRAPDLPATAELDLTP